MIAGPFINNTIISGVALPLIQYVSVSTFVPVFWTFILVTVMCADRQRQYICHHIMDILDFKTTRTTHRILTVPA